MAIETCFECQTTVEEDQGRWLIRDEVESESEWLVRQCAQAPSTVDDDDARREAWGSRWRDD